MQVVSVNVGLPRDVLWKGRTVTTGIFKEPVAGRVQVRKFNLDGDKQADLSVHGGADKAVYLYPVEHYAYWRRELPDMELPWGMFGENLTTEGLLEDGVNIGDRFRVGSAEVVVTQPRMPCQKLAIRFGRSDIIKRFLASGRTGLYVRTMPPPPRLPDPANVQPGRAESPCATELFPGCASPPSCTIMHDAGCKRPAGPDYAPVAPAILI